ncbi:Na/H+ antiporter [Anopheles sinensis]|uniref:Na/H+ antiporter n=1 Tax=Anopheles sinensis TaxID=74873 RepID=A0A084WKI7_ANOSI|nr:Na/H+ antiporter [Anopheles sinensis]
MEQRPHRCITPSTDPWRECCDDRRLPPEGSTGPAAGALEEEEERAVLLMVLVSPAPPVVALVFSADAAVVAVARRPSDAEVPRDLFVAATLTAFLRCCLSPRFPCLTHTPPALLAHTHTLTQHADGNGHDAVEDGTSSSGTLLLTTLRER